MGGDTTSYVLSVSVTIGVPVGAVKGSHTNGVAARGWTNGTVKWRELAQVDPRHGT